MSLRAIVSCLTIVDGAAATANVATSLPGVDDGGFDDPQSVSLPSPCFAPIIFVGPSATAWFAVTGQ
jgi:hypothetical protein